MSSISNILLCIFELLLVWAPHVFKLTHLVCKARLDCLNELRSLPEFVERHHILIEGVLYQGFAKQHQYHNEDIPQVLYSQCVSPRMIRNLRVLDMGILIFHHKYLQLITKDAIHIRVWNA